MTPYYEEGGITLYCGDCREILPEFEDKSFDLCLTDPPYGIKRFEKGFGYTRFRGYGVEVDGITWDKKPDRKTLMLCLDKSKQSVVWGANNFQLPPTEHFLVWDKMQTVDNFASAEYAWSSLSTPAKVFRLSIHKHNHSDKYHPTQKPVPLMKWCLGFAPEAIIVLDPFCGSGTTLLAAKQLGRKAVGIEISEKYCEIAVKRLAQMELFR